MTQKWPKLYYILTELEYPEMASQKMPKQQTKNCQILSKMA